MSMIEVEKDAWLQALEIILERNQIEHHIDNSIEWSIFVKDLKEFMIDFMESVTPGSITAHIVQGTSAVPPHVTWLERGFFNEDDAIELCNTLNTGMQALTADFTIEDVEVEL